MQWQRDPVRALESLCGQPGPALGARPAVMCAPVLRVLVGTLSEEAAGTYDSAGRREFATELHGCLLDACSPHLAVLSFVGGQQLVGSRMAACDIQFKDNPEACARRQAVADVGVLLLSTSKGNLHLPVKAQPGRIPSDCAQIHVYNLPMEFNRQGIIAEILACAGYTRNVLVKAEFGGSCLLPWLPATQGWCVGMWPWVWFAHRRGTLP